MSNYDAPIHSTYTLKAATVSAAATLLSVVGPAGKQGHLVGMSAVVTTSTTVAATALSVGITGTLGKYGSLSVPIATAGPAAAYNAMTSLTTGATNGSAVLIAADTAILLSSDGGSTAGAADITVTIAWF